MSGIQKGFYSYQTPLHGSSIGSESRGVNDTGGVVHVAGLAFVLPEGYLGIPFDKGNLWGSHEKSFSKIFSTFCMYDSSPYFFCMVLDIPVRGVTFPSHTPSNHSAT